MASLDNGGFALGWTIADATVQSTIAYLAFGAAYSPSGGSGRIVCVVG